MSFFRSKLFFAGAVPALALIACGSEAPMVVRIPAQLQSSLISPSQVVSFQLWVLSQVGRDAKPISCDELLNRTLVPADSDIIVVKQPITANFAGAPVAVSGIADGQQDRIFYVDLFDQANALGNRIGAGCTQSVTILGGKTMTVTIAVDTPPKAIP